MDSAGYSYGSNKTFDSIIGGDNSDFLKNLDNDSLTIQSTSGGLTADWSLLSSDLSNLIGEEIWTQLVDSIFSGTGVWDENTGQYTFDFQQISGITTNLDGVDELELGEAEVKIEI
jgi:hypothetical protein